MSDKLELENQILKLQVENLEVKMENLKLKHDDALKKLKEENDNLKSLVDKNKATNKQIEAKDAEIDSLGKQISEKDEEIKRLMAELSEKEEKKLSDEERRKREAEEFDARKAEVVELSTKKQKILEGIEKYVSRMRSTTNFFPTYNEWFEWLKQCSYGVNNDNTQEEIHRNYLFVKYSGESKLIHFTEYSEFPIMSGNEIVIPVLDKGWTRETTTVFLLQPHNNKAKQVKPVTASFTEELMEPSIGRYFSMKIPKTDYSCKLNSIYCTMLVFIRQSPNVI